MFRRMESYWDPEYPEAMPPRPQGYDPEPRPSLFGRVLLVLLSIGALVIAAIGISQLAGIPLSASLALSGMFQLMRIYFLRRPPWYERFSNTGWDRFGAYLVTASFFVMITAFGLYWINMAVNHPPPFSFTAPTPLAESSPTPQPTVLPADPADDAAPAPHPPAGDDGVSLEAKEGERPMPEAALPQDDPETEYREDRPVWWNRRFREARTPAPRAVSRAGLIDLPIGAPLKEADRNLALASLRPPAAQSIAFLNLATPVATKGASAPPITFEGFWRDTFTHANRAAGCWVLALILEALLVLLIYSTRQ